MLMLRHLSEGNLEAAAALSNAPRQRLELLRGYRDAIGEADFKRVFGRYLAPENKLIAEVAIGQRRLLVWELGEAGRQLAGQIYVETGGKFLMDDVPSAERSKLKDVLETYRRKSAGAEKKSGSEPDFPKH
ncbi:MAG TPA: hypothetical protein VNP36_08110 [Burkholderiales bacterium]|nr:hypothetical protein [Burkholderiales bacterium]